MINNWNIKIFALIVSSAILGACSDSKPEIVDPNTVPFQVPEWDRQAEAEVDTLLKDSAARSTNALETLAMIERTRTEPRAQPVSEAIDSLPLELQRPATVSWSGLAETLAMRISRRIGYDFRVTGNIPSQPIFVTVDAVDLPTIKILEDIGLQINPRATLVVDTNAKRIEVRYEG